MSKEVQLDMHPEPPRMDMHKLTGITLVNWYLFGAETIPFEGNSLLIRGANGVGKSSVLDAIQTILAGGDENVLSMNAASSDGKRSGRTIRSYVLGEVAESPGLKACEPRSTSNCYICLSFMSKTNKPFTIGIGLYARAKESKSLQKYPFIVDGYALSHVDFMKDEHTILPWSSLEQKLKSMPGTLMLPQSAREYRQQYCELLSAAGASNAIAPEMMFRAVKNGLIFKEQKDISEFTRQHILPENNIDVIRIENDYQEYQRIQSIIEDARDRLEALNTIITLLKNHRKKQQLSLAYQWCEYEASVQDYDERIETMEIRKEGIGNELENIAERLIHIQGKSPSLEKNRDAALLAYKNSASQQALETCEDSIEKTNHQIRSDLATIGHVRALLAGVEQLLLPSTASQYLTTAFNDARAQLMTATGFSANDMMRQWPIDIDNIDQTTSALNHYAALRKEISITRDTLKTEFDCVAERYKTLETALEKSSSGKSSLMPQTEAVIHLLQMEGINAVPVCDLAQITDIEWQAGIERFLGGNREALVIMNNVESSNGYDDFDKAIQAYRRAKNDDGNLRNVKLINPDKLFSEDQPKKGYAGYLIESTNPIARRYLKGLLRNVKLVETEEELRQEKRAITKDGMVAGNGSISGGNRLRWILIGQEARKRHALTLAEELAELKPIFARHRDDWKEIDTINTVFSSDISRAIDACINAKATYETLNTTYAELDVLNKQKNQLCEKTDDALKDTFTVSDEAWKQCLEEEKETELAQQKLQGEASTIATSLPGLNRQIKEFGQQRNKVSHLEGFSQEKSSQTFEELADKFGECAYSAIVKEAIERHRKNAEQSQKHRENGLKAMVEFVERHDIEDKEELVVMEPLAALSRCEQHAERIENAEIIRYLHDAQIAQETMLANFRSEVVAKLKECFSDIDNTFKTLNRTLADLTFNSNRYRFTWPLKDVPTLKLVHEYVTDTSDLEVQSVDDMFDTAKDHPAIEVIQQILVDGRLSEISDYRNFYSYDIISKNVDTETERKFSELLSVGSGGEKQAPFYVALGAAFMSAYKVRKVGDRIFGGAAIAIFDEAFSKMDGNNAKAALNFFRDIGLQVILAAPPESEIKVGPYVDKSLSIIRPGDSIYIDYKTYHPKGRKALESDNPHINKSIIASFINEVKEEMNIE
ncbi:MAG: hypothetical protein ACI9D5_002755 [Candidatus Endobugula sp.]|jgi:uncharacterized protein YPO0396